MTDADAQWVRYFALSEDEDSGQQRSSGAGRMRFVELRCYPKPGPVAADGHARWVLERTVVPVPSTSDASPLLGDAVDNYVATMISDRAFAATDTWWIVSDPGGLAADAAAVQHAQQGLHRLLFGDPAQAVCQALGGPVPGMVGDIAGQLPLPIDRPLQFIQQALEVAGMAVGVFAGMPVLTTACCKAFLHDQLTRTLARGIHAVIRDVLAPGGGTRRVAATDARRPTGEDGRPPGDGRPRRVAATDPRRPTGEDGRPPGDGRPRRVAATDPTARGRDTGTSRGGSATPR